MGLRRILGLAVGPDAPSYDVEETTDEGGTTYRFVPGVTNTMTLSRADADEIRAKALRAGTCGPLGGPW